MCICACGRRIRIKGLFHECEAEKACPSPTDPMLFFCPRIEVVEYLVREARVDPQLPTVTGITPLLIACREGAVDLVRCAHAVAWED